MIQDERDEISFDVAQNHYYAAIISIVFVAGATSSWVLGLSLGAMLILFYAMFIPMGITISTKGVTIRRWLRKSPFEKNAVRLFISGEKQKKVLQLTFPNAKRCRQIQVIIDNESQLIESLDKHGYEIRNAA